MRTPRQPEAAAIMAKPPSTSETGGNGVPDPIPPERWTLTVEAVGIGPPMVVRVRRLLKAAGRCYGLRCVVAKENEKGNLDNIRL